MEPFFQSSVDIIIKNPTTIKVTSGISKKNTSGTLISLKLVLKSSKLRGYNKRLIIDITRSRIE
jgi:hypothetical protein